MKLARLITIAIIGLAILPSACSAAPDGPTVMKRMLAAEGSTSYVARQATSISRRHKFTSEQIIYKAGNRGMRIEFTSPPMLARELMIDDGKNMYHYMPQKKTMQVFPSRLREMQSRGRSSSRDFMHGILSAKVVGRDTVAGRNAYIVEICPARRPSGAKRKFWIDAEKWVKLRTEEIAPDGSVTAKSYFTKITFVASIPRSKFAFTPPAGTKIERIDTHRRMSLKAAGNAAGFTVLKPSYVPPGFKLLGANVMPFRGGKVVVQRYCDGINSFSLFESTVGGKHQGFAGKPVGSAEEIYSWKIGDINLTIVGRISRGTIRRIADSVK